jgi:glutaredoxin 3
VALELFGTRVCPYTAELREELEWQGRAFVEYDVDADPAAFARLRVLVSGAAAVPVLVEEGRVLQVGYHGRSCFVSPA